MLGITSIYTSACQQVAHASFPATPPFHVLASGVPVILISYTASSATATAQAQYCDVVTIGVGELFP